MYELRIDRGTDVMIWNEVEYMTIAPECIKIWAVGEELCDIIPVMMNDKINVRWIDNVYK